MRFRLHARCLSEWETVERAEYHVSSLAAWNWMLSIAAEVRKHDAHSMTFFRYPVWFSRAEDGEEVRVDCPELVIADDSFHFQGCIKHSDPPILVESECVDFDDVEYIADGEYTCPHLKQLIDDEQELA